MVAFEIHNGIVYVVETGIFITGEISSVVGECIHYTINEVRTGKLYAIFIIVGLNTINFEPAVKNNNAVDIFFAVGVNTVEKFTVVFASKLAISVNCPIVT